MPHDDAAYNMVRVVKAEPFPHRELRTTRPPDAAPDELSDDLLNWLAWQFVEREMWCWAFRGLGRHLYRLESTLDRRLAERERSNKSSCCSHVERQTAEDYLLSQFKKAAHHFVESSLLPTTKLEWLALIQHFGGPTRLLDFTRSPYVACFFAIEQAPPDNSSPEADERAIWAIDTDWLVAKGFRHLSNDYSRWTEASLFDSDFVAENFEMLFVNQSQPLVLPVVPSRSNPRLLVQQGLFLCPSMIEAGVEKSLASNGHDTQEMSKHALKIIVEGRIRPELLWELRLMNITRASLFPGLDGFASSLGVAIELSTADEIKRSR